LDLLDLFGSGYVIDHCVSAFSKKQQDKLYKIYVTDCLQSIAENTTHILSANGVVDYGMKMSTRWIDLAEKKSEPKKEKAIRRKSVSEIVDGIWANIRKGGGD
jgi:hypothetical protein